MSADWIIEAILLLEQDLSIDWRDIVYTGEVVSVPLGKLAPTTHHHQVYCHHINCINTNIGNSLTKSTTLLLDIMQYLLKIRNDE